MMRDKMALLVFITWYWTNTSPCLYMIGGLGL